MTGSDELLTVKDAARLLRVSRRTLWTLMQRGHLPYLKFGRIVRLELADICRFREAARISDLVNR